jgi:hypothetical protein
MASYRSLVARYKLLPMDRCKGICPGCGKGVYKGVYKNGKWWHRSHLPAEVVVLQHGLW